MLSRGIPMKKNLCKAILAAITLTTMSPVMAAPATMVAPAAAVCVTGSCVQPGTVSPGNRQRQIWVIMPNANRTRVLVTVRPGQDDRAAAFEYLLQRTANTIADANHLQSTARVTGIWRQGTDGIDIVDFQSW